MFPKNKINIIYRLLCLVSYLIVILTINSLVSLIMLLVIYILFAIAEKNFRNIELVVVSVVLFLLCHSVNNYLLMKIMLLVDYGFYFLDTSYYVDEKDSISISQKEYVRFKEINEKKEGTNNLIAIFVTIHLVLLVIAIMVG